MGNPLNVLKCGSCETLKAAVHGTALGLSVVMGVYNAAAWLSRREQHLAINTVLYAVLTAWEQKQVARHLAEIRGPREAAVELDAAPAAASAPEPIDVAA